MAQQTKSSKEISHNCSTVVDVLRLRSSTQPTRRAFTFLEDGESQEATLTYQQLDKRSRAIASQLQALNLKGERALLLYPPGLDYLSAFFGCLYAGVVAVPAYPPQNKRKAPRIQAISTDAQARIALTTTAMLPTLQSILAQQTNLENIRWLVTDNLAEGLEDSWQQPDINADTIAFLQYTSGSTGIPKGVMLSHSNLLHNAAATYQFMGHSPNSKFVSWLPVYHDMGLIGGILQPLYGGFSCILMSPASFLQRPFRWLQAISRYKGTTSGAPNFAYEYCIHKITPEQRSCLDLSSWSVAFNGAEPVRQDTLEQFALTFAECGFRREAFYPCYGMAEATLMVSGGSKTALPIVKKVQKSALANNQVIEVSAQTQDKDIQTFVSCGKIIPQQQIVIANPETLTRSSPNQVGEIWVSGPSVGQGYWHRQEETERTFRAYLKDTGEGPFLRTGDLGFLDNGELFITGRAKDLIIIRGRNLYPQDIELTTERSHPSLRSSSTAAFSVEVNDQEQLVIVQELEFRAKPDINEATTAIRQAVTEEHEVQVHAVVLIKPGTIPKTSSGKIQRRATKVAFLAGELDVVGSSISNNTAYLGKENHLQRQTLLALTPEESQPLLESYLREQVARVLSVAPQEINPQQPLSSLGLDSLRVFELKNQIEADLEVTVSVADFFEELNTRSLSTKILTQLATTTSIPSISVTQVQKTTSVHPLSFSQQGLWFIHQFVPDSPAYNIPILINCKGKINEAVVAQSLNEIIRRHAVLRTNFVVVDGQPLQVIQPATKLTLLTEDLQQVTLNQRAEQVRRLASEFAQQPFDLSSQPLLRAKLLRLDQQEYTLLLTLHHIIADGWSIGILIQELAALYAAFSRGEPSPLPELPIQYIDFAYWQRQWLQSDRIQTLLTYWKQQLGGKLPVLNLPTDRPRSPIQTFKGAQARLTLSPTLTAELKKLGHSEGVTLFMTMLTAFKILLYRYTGQTDILVGSPIANRNQTEVKSLIGYFVNVLVLRTDLANQPSFRELLSQVKSTALEAYIHQDLPFEKLVEELHLDRDLSYNPLFQVMFVLQNVPIPSPKLSDISITCQEGENGTAKFDLTLFVADTEHGLLITAEYNTDLFNADTIHRLLGHFQTLLTGVVKNPDQCIADLPLLTAPEKQQLLVDWNNTKTDYPQNLCVHHLFEEQVEQTPDAIAVVFNKETFAYRELNQRANQIAHSLQQLGVQPDVIVGICMERSPEMVIGILAILKAGGAYLPLDTAYPQERLALMLADAGVKVLLTQQHLVKKLPPHQAQVICLDTDSETFAAHSQENLVGEVKPENLAYVIYTSGSTGIPKGVMNTHLGLCNRLLWMQDAYQLTPADRVLQKTPFSFDVSVWEFFWPLLTGAILVLAKPEGHKDAGYLVELIAQEQITTLHFVRSMLQVFLEAPGLEKCQSLKRVICSGEALPFDLQERFFESLDAELYNLYGPTEAAIDVTAWRCQRGSNEKIVPIGRPIANTQIYILDRHLQPVPIGVPGELHIGGVGLARGYLNRPELTEEKFIPNPLTHFELPILDYKLGDCSKNPEDCDRTQFSNPKSVLESSEVSSGTLRVNRLSAKSQNLKFNRLYKTGDLARYRPDGNIEFLGRIDHQVKIRGFRIELGEIEAVLGQHPQVREVVVIATEDRLSERRLVAYVVPNQDHAPSIDELRDRLREKLPEYMVPSAFVMLDALPLTPNGKVDRRALPAPDSLRPELASTYQPPQSQIEQEIAKVWQTVLHLEKVGVNDNFFDLGGNSLLMVQVTNKLQAVFQRNLSVVAMFQHPTISSLTQYLSQQPEDVPAFGSMRDRAQKQMEVLNQRKNFWIKQNKKTRNQ
ncbi:non-ribosomal peptide synthetase [Fischerella thermalis]|uniref:non-ribosomal peptide synthetase n=1 Tax=Fischerella thermalis TaxID=372787 RepID=UPI000C7FFF22|nr:non-ribosomal peptide synthetase [Fischerella thermalis]PLZ48403.1 non-ribosomal peptide synthetase [Fischerella thermalis WC442]PLZ83963.1 non-ribosomal peptide synthetase [Fischerella thermalis WC213]